MILFPPKTLRQLCDHAGGEIRRRLAELGSPDLPHPLEVIGDGDILIESVAPVEALEPGCLTFATSQAYLDEIEQSPAVAIIIPPDLTPGAKPVIRAPIPRLVFSIVLELIRGERTLVPAAPEGIRFKDRASVEIGEDVVIGDGCYVGSTVRIGRGSRIYPQVFIDDDVVLGENCVVYPHVTLFRGTMIGRRVIIHAGAVIGDDGFGYNQVPDPSNGRLHHLKNEHAGGVRIDDDVEVGSQVCIDRGLAGQTVIGAGTKIDNLVQIGHNCQIGRECILVAQVGLGGTTRLGDQVFLLGQAGLKNGVTVGDGAIVTARAMVLQDIPAGRARWAGQPCREADVEWKHIAMARRELPRIREFLRVFKKAESFDDLKEVYFGTKTSRGQED